MLTALLILQAFLPAASIDGQDHPVTFGPPVFVTHIVDQGISEASGMAASGRSDDYYWIINDSQNGPELFAVDRRGNTLAAVRVTGADNIDWESLDSLEIDGTHYLMIADVGDNEAARPEVLIHFVKEPDPTVEQSISPEWSVSLHIPRGAADIEAVFADTDTGHVYLLTKREKPPQLWRFPLDATGPTDAEWRCAVENVPQPGPADLAEDPKLGPTRSQVTGIDTLPDGTGAMILTYGNAYFYDRSPGQSWCEAFAQAPRTILMPRLVKPEAMTFSNDGRRLAVTSEHWPAPLIELAVSR